jgi:hypothetical protein
VEVELVQASATAHHKLAAEEFVGGELDHQPREDEVRQLKGRDGRPNRR